MAKRTIKTEQVVRPYDCDCPACGKPIAKGKTAWTAAHADELSRAMGEYELGCSKRCAIAELKHQSGLADMDVDNG